MGTACSQVYVVSGKVPLDTVLCKKQSTTNFFHCLLTWKMSQIVKVKCMNFLLFCVHSGNFRAGVFIQLQSFRHAGNKYVDEEKREEEEERRGRKEREGRERGKGRRKVHVVLSLDQSFHVRPVASVKNRVWAPSLEKLGHNYNSIYGHVDQSAQGSSTSSQTVSFQNFEGMFYI